MLIDLDHKGNSYWIKSKFKVQGSLLDFFLHLIIIINDDDDDNLILISRIIRKKMLSCAFLFIYFIYSRLHKAVRIHVRFETVICAFILGILSARHAAYTNTTQVCSSAAALVMSIST